ncbi:MAG: dihydrolipoyl dehydrogenase [Lysobacterales bacterium]|jgi:dihydrolipoamide dehydrogenase|nr:MAG: dihydrolipoyl dehydrogenase [Xanthomonadales bacterium]
MSERIEVRVPDIGDFRDVPVIEVLVSPGERVRKDQGLVTLESDKATMEVPATAEGVVVSLAVKVGDKVSEGSLIATLEVGEAEAASVPAPPLAGSPAPVERPSAPAVLPSAKADHDCEIAVIGAGPGGYTAAFRAADLGRRVLLIERYPELGGVCLNVGCIPSKALLHAAGLIEEAEAFAAHGIHFGKPRIELEALAAFKASVVAQLNRGLAGMAKQRKVERLTGRARFADPHHLEVETAEGSKRVRFEKAIIAVGSRAVKLPIFPWGDPRIMDSTDALALSEIPRRLLVVGGGIIGLEMACVYSALGSEITVVELMDQLMPGTDPDLVKPLHDRIRKRYAAILLKTKVIAAEATREGIRVRFEGEGAPAEGMFDRVLVAVGRIPNGREIAAERAGVQVDERGFISVDRQMRTNVAHIFAIGDVTGPPMLAHKATHEGKVAAEVAAGEKSEFVARVIPSVAYTDPEVAWVGVTETEAKRQGLEVGVGKFPHAASGRAIGIARTEGFTKLVFDKATHRVIGGGIVGPHAGDLIAEVTLAIEMGAEAADIGLSIHPHPTLAETVGMAAEVFEGTVTDLFLPRRR